MPRYHKDRDLERKKKVPIVDCYGKSDDGFKNVFEWWKSLLECDFGVWRSGIEGVVINNYHQIEEWHFVVMRAWVCLILVVFPSRVTNCTVIT